MMEWATHLELSLVVDSGLTELGGKVLDRFLEANISYVSLLQRIMVLLRLRAILRPEVSSEGRSTNPYDEERFYISQEPEQRLW